MANFITKIFGSRNQRLLKDYSRIVSRINELEEGYKALSDDKLADKTTEFKKRVSDGEALDDILPEAFGVVSRPVRKIPVFVRCRR